MVHFLKQNQSDEMDSFARVVTQFFNFLTQLKVYHWQTTSFSIHKSTDDLHIAMSALVDRFVEAYQGRNMMRVSFGNDDIFKVPQMYSFESYLSFLIKMREFLTTTVPLIIDVAKDSDLVTIRDDMLEQVNKALYLATLS